MNILMVSSEAGPYARTGGLGDVLAALPGALATLGHDVKLVIPAFGSINRNRFNVVSTSVSMQVPVAGETVRGNLLRAGDRGDRVERLLIECPRYFDRADFYVDPLTGKDYPDNDHRFAFFARAALEAVKQLKWSPDVVHGHDWQAALVPVYLKTAYASDPLLARARTVLTIHNLGYQGLFAVKRFADLGLPGHLMAGLIGPLEFFGKVNFLKGGIVMADRVTTVSERYAEEIQSGDEFGCGLQGVLKNRAADLHGIVNGVDYSVWSPSRDKLIPARFGLSNLSGKRTTRIELMNAAGLPVRERVPLVGMVTRLTAQKGLDLLVEAADELFAMNLQMIILGAGDEKLQTALRLIEREYPDKLKVYLEFNDALAHRIQAGADICLMPSRYEPCGLNQLYALKYGTVPVVRSVGGLADTVENYDTATGAGTGFAFGEYTSDAMLGALERAIGLFARKQAWTRLMKAGMARDFSWGASARKYSALYESLVG